MKNLKYALIAISMVIPFLFPIFSSDFKIFGGLAMNLLVVILIIRPLTQIFPQINFFKKLLGLRREMGILCGSFVLTHSSGYFIKTEQFPHELFSQPNFFTFENFLVWGVLGVIITILLLITSNNISVKILKRYWKTVQRLAYILLIAGSYHIFYLTDEITLGSIIESFWRVFIVIIFVSWAEHKRKK